MSAVEPGDREPSRPASASAALRALLEGPWVDLPVLAATRAALYLSAPGSGGDPRVVALLAPGAVRLPIGIRVGHDALPLRGAGVVVGHGRVVGPDGGWRIRRWWDPRPRVDPIGLVSSGAPLLEVLEAEPEASFGLPLTDALEIAGALARGDRGPAMDALGLGPGLTPAADDVVAGALSVLGLSGRLAASTRVAIEERAATRTTALSAALLSAAARGQVIPEAGQLLEVLGEGRPHDVVSTAAAELFRVGSTSGHDLCAGMGGALAALRPRMSVEVGAR